MNQIPKISIILPTYNGAKYLRRTIESIFPQSFSDWELIIVNDGSSDKSEDIIQEYLNLDYRLVYIKNEINLGIQKTLNIGIEVSKGKYIARIDDDDVWIDNDKLKRQIEFFENNNDYILVGTGAIITDNNGKEITRYLMPLEDKQIRSKMLRTNCFIHSSVLFKKESLEIVGGYKGLLEDYDLWLRLGLIGKMANIDTYSVRYSFNFDGVNTTNKNLRLKENLVLAKKYKKHYPNYFYSLIMGYSKMFGYHFFKYLPLKIEGIILKFHKSL